MSIGHPPPASSSYFEYELKALSKAVERLETDVKTDVKNLNNRVGDLELSRAEQKFKNGIVWAVFGFIATGVGTFFFSWLTRGVKP